MKGYYTDGAYYGWIPHLHRYMEFESDAAYAEYFRENY